ncbi:MAG: NADH-quinone oxidoreductase subunit K [Candidatus Schekmanbacteria bacterium RIFCSPLOWO2_02_FULL_38_14]|uniref:NADH-quinone oxidoreductase subunit K n=1 Tax=Candidatus Schekmanbacteria bacterium RIFCSPLOWO2_12_FULL_38_15 TaxID=1817883 RepID=A0A1F7SGI1_9BACT|nr:MAG: NADH-quinone oxidoreductase subunit K [Candidatus Schekmanbacteria bacterium RIFCSPLOWO2_02_FULL_38_14]OGL52865.1 MAG: NADH-quinone oxidoreductase subunit K [Candidatus Schekmanbacteria bacterium RIFCSPLOWO2_12_FULL_38_15]
MIPLNWYLYLSAVLFIVGAVGVLTRKNAILILMSIELMLNSAAINFIAFSYYFGSVTGQIFAIMIITVAASEAAIGLAIIISMYRNKNSINIDDYSLLKG